MSNIVPILTLESQLKRAIRSHLRKLGFTRQKDGWLQPPANDKDAIRALHHYQRKEKIEREYDFIKENWTSLADYFANGKDIDPKKIRPVLVQVEAGTTESDIFRLATHLWSIPVSQGYGRRLRFLVIDASNGCLMGLFALGDPVFNLNARDRWINWSSNDRKQRLVNVLDCFVLGSVPPYNSLLSAKMVACLVRSQEVWNAFEKKYSKKKGIISGQRKHAHLTLVTTTSALGRSSIYNRLALNGLQYFKRIGFTSGWGHFHIPVTLYSQIREYLEKKKHPYADNNRFGDGPNWKLRTIRAALESIGFDKNILCHGVLREIFACEFATNSLDYLGGRDKQPQFDTLLSIDTISDLALSRWILPRSERNIDYKLWKKQQTFEVILGHKTPAAHCIGAQDIDRVGQ